MAEIPRREHLSAVLFSTLLVVSATVAGVGVGSGVAAAKSGGIDSVSVTAATDADGDGYVSSFQVEIATDTTLSGWDGCVLGICDDGEPYLDVTVGGQQVATRDVGRTSDGDFTFALNGVDWSQFDRTGSLTVTVALRDDDIASDDTVASTSKTVAFEPPADDPDEIAYLLTVESPDNGEYVLDPPAERFEGSTTRSYASGTRVTLTADPDDGYRFDGWTGDVSADRRDAQSITLTMDATRIVRPTFVAAEKTKSTTTETTAEPATTESTTTEPAEYELSVTAPGSGGFTLDPPSVSFSGDARRTYESGTEVTLTAEPGPNAEFDGWTGDVPTDKRDSASITVRMDRDRHLKPVFERTNSAALTDPKVAFESNAGVDGLVETDVSQDNAIDGYAVESLANVPDTEKGDVVRNQLGRAEEWRDGKTVAVLSSGVTVPNVFVAKRQVVDHRVGVATYSDEWTAEASGTHEVNITPDFYVGAGVLKFDLGYGGSACAASRLFVRAQVENVETGEIVAGKTREVLGAKYPHDCNPPATLGRYAKKGVVVGGKLALSRAASKAGVKGPWVKPATELAEYYFVDKTEVEEQWFRDPVSVTADLEAGEKYRWEFAFVGDTRAAGTSRFGIQRTFAIAGVNGELASVDVERGGGEGGTPETRLTSVPGGRVADGDATYEWKSATPDASGTEYAYRLVGRHDGEVVVDRGWTDWSASTTASFDDLPVGNYTFSVKSRADGGVEPEPARHSFTVGGDVELSANDSALAVSAEEGERLTLTVSARESAADVTLAIGGERGVADHVHFAGGGTERDLGTLDAGETRTVQVVADADAKAGALQVVAQSVGGANASVGLTVSKATNGAPSASLSTTGSASAGGTVALDASGSSDPDGDDLTYEWSIVDAPSGSDLALPDGVTGEVRLPTAGEYTFVVTVSDGRATDEARVTVTTTGSSGENDRSVDPPITVLGAGVTGGLAADDGAVYALSRTGSGERIVKIDPAAETVTRTWEVPNGRASGIAVGDAALWTVDFDSGNVYRVDLDSGVVTLAFSVDFDPAGVGYGDGSLWIGDISANNVYEFSTSGDRRGRFSVSDQTYTVKGVAYHDGRVWVGDADGGASPAQLYEYTPDGDLISTSRTGVSTSGLGGSPWGVLGPDSDRNVRILADSASDDGDADGKTLLDDGFEDDATGSYPGGWQSSGNDADRAVGSPVADGDRAFRLEGSPGSCWESLSHRKVPLPDEGRVAISLSVRPTDEGSYGCHDTHGRVEYKTQASWSSDGVKLLDLARSGTIRGTGLSLGDYRLDRWHDVKIVYERSGNKVKLTYFVDGNRRGSTTRDARRYEDGLQYLTLASGDFVTLFDEVTVERTD